MHNKYNYQIIIYKIYNFNHDSCDKILKKLNI